MDLISSRSGVYHAAEPEAISNNRPALGSHQPGSTWWYNNWDFNTVDLDAWRCRSKEEEEGASNFVSTGTACRSMYSFNSLYVVAKLWAPLSAKHNVGPRISPNSAGDSRAAFPSQAVPWDQHLAWRCQVGSPAVVEQL